MKRRVRLLAGAAALTVVLATVSPAAATAAVDPPSRGGGSGSDGRWVTLVTGHRVFASRTAEGRWTALTEPEPGGRAAGFVQYDRRHGDETDLYVLPHEAVPLVRAGTLDVELFNVSGLVRQRYDDAHTDTVPLLVEYPDVAATAAPEGSRVERTLPDLRLAAVEERKADARRFWSAVTAGEPGAARLAVGPRWIWLNA
ncbi:MAG: hypothetical protein HOV94_05485, partial [Saccharothrix sp.]|nr:hypothetical protein [Saccharothrix sp.]